MVREAVKGGTRDSYSSTDSEEREASEQSSGEGRRTKSTSRVELIAAPPTAAASFVERARGRATGDQKRDGTMEAEREVQKCLTKEPLFFSSR